MRRRKPNSSPPSFKPGMRIRALCLALCVSFSATAYAQSPVSYRLSFPEAQHHRMQVDIVFPDVPTGTLEVLMSTTSPGRYAIHDFARNVYDVQIDDGAGAPLSVERANHPNGTSRDIANGTRPLQVWGITSRHAPGY